MPAVETIRGSLYDCLVDMEQRYNQPGLQQAALQAPYAEYRPNGNKYPGATGTPAERRILYALATLPSVRQIVECGVNWGVSTIQLLSGKHDDTYLTAVDIARLTEGHPIGHLIPGNLRQRFDLKTGWDAESYLQQRIDPIDLLFEDTDHTLDTTRAIYEAVHPRLRSGAWLVSHDATNYPSVPDGIVAAGFEPVIYVPDNTPFGLTICRL